MSEAMCMHENGTHPTERQNRRGKKLQTIYTSMLRVFSYVSLAGRVKNERVNYRKCRVYI